MLLINITRRPYIIMDFYFLDGNFQHVLNNRFQQFILREFENKYRNLDKINNIIVLGLLIT